MNTEQIIDIFNVLFRVSHETILEHSEGEPLYIPKSVDSPLNSIKFSHGFFSSALHEISHWLIAGKERRTQKDLGYWYKPDGRSKDDQILFCKYETKNQGLEWLLSLACGMKFHVSSDNLSGEIDAVQSLNREFAREVRVHAKKFIKIGFSPRAENLINTLLNNFGTKDLYYSQIALICDDQLLPDY